MDVNKQLCEAIMKQNLHEVERLLAMPGIDINNGSCRDGKSALQLVIGGNSTVDAPLNSLSVEILNRLLAVPGIDVNHVRFSSTPLISITAINAYYNLEKRQAIQRMGVALINHPTMDLNKIIPATGFYTPSLLGQTGTIALCYAVSNGHTDIVRHLLSRPEIDVNQAPLNHRIVPITIAAEAVDPSAKSAYKREMFDILLDVPGINVNAMNYNNLSALHILVNRNDYSSDYTTDIIRRLIAHPDINVNIQNARNETPLINAVQRGDIRVIPLLLDAGAHTHPRLDLDIEDNDGNTALMIAARLGSGEIVRLLLDAGAKTNYKNKEGKRAEQIAIDNGFMDIASMIGARYAEHAMHRRMPVLAARNTIKYARMTPVEAAMKAFRNLGYRTGPSRKPNKPRSRRRLVAGYTKLAKT
jgi:ankyrin repeat protein